MAAIVLTTLNARYIHASLGLRYLRANLGAHREKSVLCEFTIKRPASEIADEILRIGPRLVGFGVYIWNTRQTLEVIKLLKMRNPEIIVVAGGPEISYETEDQEIFKNVDFVFQGEADFTFRDFAAAWLEQGILPSGKIIPAVLPEIAQLQMPYIEFTDEDIQHRTLYVEASRGCPYKCEYCLSALDKSVRSFDTVKFLGEMQKLIDRGARQFKFVDRTFNLAPKISSRILQFFLQQIELGLFLHFEMVPDRLDEGLRALIKQFPPGALQFEIGVQTWNPSVAANVSRRQNYAKIVENFDFLRRETKVHTHADLIVGLPGETWESFAAGFNALYELKADEIQVGILKRLKGTPIVRHDEKFQMRYSGESPFEIISNKDLSAMQISELKIFAEFWDLIANSGRFPGLTSLAPENPFAFYFELSKALYSVFGRTHSIHLNELENAVQNYLSQTGRPVALGVVMQKQKSKSAATPYRQAQHL